MAYVIAIVVVLMMVGSVLWLKPSPAQQRQTRMRLLARQLGVEVRLCTLPQTRRARVRLARPEQGVVYRLPIYERRDPPPPDYLLCRDDAATPWESENASELPTQLRARLEAAVAKLPADAVAIELAPHGPAVYWRESGDVQMVQKLAELLLDLRLALQGKPA